MQIQFDGHLPIDPLSQSRQAAQAASQSQTQAQASQSAGFKSEFEEILNKAMDAGKNSPEKLEQIRQELESGELDSPQAARDAAVNMLKFGI